ncbi:MAG: hypothetical protein KBC64_03080 [Simkaniaceae bacterium]|nr:hypothetical protein [Simkaniaceae bacterium]
MDPLAPLQRKVYSKLSTSPLKGPIGVSTDTPSPKKIVATKFVSRLQEEFKQTFIPVLIEVFKLRQLTEAYKREKEGDPFVSQLTTSPEDILRHLEEIRETVEEAKRWHEGVLSQVSRGIEETKEILAFIKKEEHNPLEQTPLWELLKQKLHL